jgi:4-cresol dehydrogenase (hydroxylating)
MEVVLPSGEILKTGGGPTENYRCWNTYKWGIGPYVDGLFAQSNLGIVVKAGVWLMPEPEAFDFLAFQYTAKDHELGNLVDDMRWLIAQGFLQSRPHLANDFAMLCIVSQYPHELLKGDPCLSPEAIRIWRQRHGVGSWTCGLGLYGTKETIRLQRKMIQKRLGKYGRLWPLGRALRGDWFGNAYFKVSKTIARWMGNSEATLDSLLPAADLYRGIPTDEFAKQVYVKRQGEKPDGKFNPPTDGCGLMWLGPVIPFTSKDVDRILPAAKEIFARHGFDFFVELIFEGPRTIICLFGIFFDKTDTEEAKRAGLWYHDLRNLCLQFGYPPYRESVQSTTQALDLNPGMKNLIADLKSVLDSNNILAPGRYGAPVKSELVHSSVPVST